CIVEVRNYYCVQTDVYSRQNEPWTVPFKRYRKLPSSTTGSTSESHQKQITKVSSMLLVSPQEIARLSGCFVQA
ncbi:MAG: hypothetical protein ACREBU_14765, partial [Nitrososphaera sp.]